MACLQNQACDYNDNILKLREQVIYVRMVVSPLWRGPGNIHNFVLDGKSYRQEWPTAQTPNELAVSGVRIATLILRTCNLTTIACGRWRRKTSLKPLQLTFMMPKNEMQK